MDGTLFKTYNYCIICKIKHKKPISKCLVCHKKLRTKPKKLGVIKNKIRENNINNTSGVSSLQKLILEDEEE